MSVFPWGRYSGREVSEVFEHDSEYCFWMLKQLRDGGKKLDARSKELLAELYRWSKDYEEPVTENSEYLPKGVTENVVCTVFFAEKHPEYTYVRAKHGNVHFLFCAHDAEVKVGDTVHIARCRSRHNGERFGVKYNYLNYIKGLEVVR